MERLTELKAGDSVPLSILYEWATEGNYCNGGYEIYTGSIVQFKQVMNPDKDNLIKIAKVTGSPYNSPFFHAYNKISYTQFKLTGFIEFYNQFYKLDTQPVANSLRILENVYFIVENKGEQDKLLNRLFELGYELNNETKLWDSFLEHWAIGNQKYISGNYGKSETFSKYTLMSIDSLFDKLKINKNNTPLNTLVNGNKIIVCKPVKTITGGQRPEGTSISGKTRSTTIRVGHLSHRAINS